MEKPPKRIGQDKIIRIENLIAPYHFRDLWFLKNLPRKLKDRAMLRVPKAKAERKGIVIEYLEDPHLHREQKALVEKTLEAELAEQLKKEGLPFFPPPLFVLGPILYLSLSERKRIRMIGHTHIYLYDPRSVLCRNNKREEIANEVKKMGYVGYVTYIAGCSSYPVLLSPQAKLQAVIRAGVSEWTHILLAHTPLRRTYKSAMKELGHNHPKTSEMKLLEENIAKISGRELSSKILAGWGLEAPEPSHNNYDGLIKIRLEAGRLLNQGKVEEAEAFMSEEGEKLGRGKLNQAFFAFLDPYIGFGEDSAGEIPAKLSSLRERCGTLKTFLKVVARFKSAKDLDRALDL